MTQYRLVIAEKPSVAKSLAAVLGAANRRDGYLEGNGWLVSWCLGHLAGLADAATYNPDYAKWRYDDLPNRGCPNQECRMKGGMKKRLWLWSLKILHGYGVLVVVRKG